MSDRVKNNKHLIREDKTMSKKAKKHNKKEEKNDQLEAQKAWLSNYCMEKKTCARAFLPGT